MGNEPNEHCWRTARAERLAFLVDGQAYFRHLAEALERANRSVWIVGWDLHSKVRLRRDADAGTAERSELGSLLDSTVRCQRGLHVHVLGWDFAMIYALERQPLPVLQLGWRTHRRVQFELDGVHPLGACHHQKIVVVDDRLAFVGGFDLTMNRWDTTEHLVADARRVNPRGESYPPFHDVQVAVSGPAAAALGELVRERWHRATGRRLRPPTPGDDPWPPQLAPELVDASVGIARTLPEYRGQPERREIEALYLRAIARAERWIYIENQYLTSSAVAAALRERLQAVRGPEVVVVVPRKTSGWLEEATMGALRARLLAGLRAADRGGRLHVYYPHRDGLDEESIVVHAKLCIVDGRFATVGSANLSNRSMGLDTECNLFVEGEPGTPTAKAVESLLDRLLAEHLGSEPARVRAARGSSGSPTRALAALHGGPRRLVSLEHEAHGWVGKLVPEAADPERPIEASDLVGQLLGERASVSPPRSALAGPVVALLALAALGLAWRFGPLGAWLDAERIASWMESYRRSPVSLPISALLYTVAGLALVPLSLLIVQTAVVFGPLAGVLHAGVGALSSALVSYALGRGLGRSRVRHVGRRWSNRIGSALRDHGVLTVAAVRLVPVAPYTIVNLVAGASQVRLAPFLLGTLVGLAPGLILLTVLGDQAVRAIARPSWTAWGVVAALVLVGFVLWATFARWARRRGETHGAI